MSQRLRDNPAAGHLNRFRGGGFCIQEGDQVRRLGPQKPGWTDGTAAFLCGDDFWGHDGDLRLSSYAHIKRDTFDDLG